MSVELTVLPSGLRVVTQAMPHVETASLGVWVGSGSRFERPGEHGISHLLEHMAFKGTARRSARQIAEEIESVGGDLNAATSAETTAYYARVLKEDVGLALDLLSDILLNARFDVEELEREKGVIVQEIAAAQDMPEDVACDLLLEAAFPGQPLGRPILGTKASVARMRPAHLRAYLARRYSAQAMVVGAAGAVRHEDVVRDVETLFAGLPVHEPPPFEPALYRGGLRRADDDFEQSHVVVAFAAPSYRQSDDYYAGQVLSGLLGGGMASRLFQEAREKRGLCYSIDAFHWGHSDIGLFGVQAATGPESLDELTDVMARELRRVADEPAEPHEVARARTLIRAGLLMSLESSGARVQRMARQLLALGRVVPVEELIEKIESVTPERLRDLAGRILGGSPVSIASVGILRTGAAPEKLALKFGAVPSRAAE